MFFFILKVDKSQVSLLAVLKSQCQSYVTCAKNGKFRLQRERPLVESSSVERR